MRQEFWAFLHSQGFPAEVNDETLQATAQKVEALAYAGKRMLMKRWKWVESAQHDDDVAVVMVLADALRLKQGLDWDWGLEVDDYHFEVAFADSDRVRELSKFVDLYHEASLMLLQVYIKVNETAGKVDLQRLFQEEFRRAREERRKHFSGV